MRKGDSRGGNERWGQGHGEAGESPCCRYPPSTKTKLQLTKVNNTTFMLGNQKTEFVLNFQSQLAI